MKQCLRTIRMACSSFRAKLLLAFLVCTLVPLGIIGCVSYGVSYSIARDKIMDSAILAADQTQVQINSRINQAENVADTLQYNMYTLGLSREKSVSAYLESLSDLRNNIALYKTTFDFSHIYVFLEDGQMGSGEGLYFEGLSDIGEWQLTREDLKGLGASSLWVYRPGIQMPYILNREGISRDFMVCCRALHNQGTGQLEYAYFIILDMEEFSNMLANTFSNTEVTCYLTAADGTVAAASGEDAGFRITGDQAASYADSQSSYFRHGDAYCYIRELDNGWYQITEIPKAYITSGTAVLLRTILLTLLLSLPVTVTMILLISKNLVKRLNKLSGSMKEFRLRPNDEMVLTTVIPRPENPDYYDEIDQLGITFETMQATIQKNLRSILDLSLTEERLKYQLLQSQINPHFLYNILGSIQICQSLGKLDTANQMITDLTRFYRLTLRKSDELITIRDELEIAQLYLNMEKLCHNQVLDWTIDLEDGIENFMICKFTLQPFLENSILHGISLQTPDIHIHIDIAYGDDTVIITLRDNGAGIPAEKLAELKENLKHKTVSYEKHFGICNVNARISSELYGFGHIGIESEPGQGTCITIEFAQIEGEGL